MKFVVTKCDFCGKEEKFCVSESPLANVSTESVDKAWRYVNTTPNKHDWLNGSEEHMCPDCYKKAKAFGKQALTLTMPKGGAK